VSDWLKSHRQAENDLMDLASALNEVSFGLRMAGIHPDLRYKLAIISEGIVAATKEARGAVSDMLREEVARGREQLASALVAALDRAEALDAQESDDADIPATGVENG